MNCNVKLIDDYYKGYINNVPNAQHHPEWTKGNFYQYYKRFTEWYMFQSRTYGYQTYKNIYLYVILFVLCIQSL